MRQCEGCRYEFEEALIEQENGLHYATSTDREYNQYGHFTIWMVDDKGKIQVW